MMDLLAAIGLALALEGALYAGAPSFMKRLLASMMETPEHMLRVSGILALVLGVIIVWVARSF